MRALLGHDGPPESMWRENLLTGKPLDRCPVRTLQLLGEESPQIVRELTDYSNIYYPAYEDGHLLTAGGIEDQPARYLELIQIVRRTEHAKHAKYDEINASQSKE